MKFGATSEKGRRGKKARYGRRKGKGKGVPPRVCPLTLLPRKIWERIAARVASASIHDLFNMQATCNVFLDAARSSAVYKVASMAEIPVVFGYDMEDLGGCDTLLEAVDAGDVQSRYMCAMLLLTPGVGDEADAGRGVELYENVLTAGKIELCRELLGQLFANPLIGVHPSDPGKPSSAGQASA
ncbi:hypothetical protein Ahy_A06g026287 [Arachis hypogaea]|uniref:F-box domain-containing protein n=1 Tax=Arachis hypogaea TaxID=3818 RepID=A0A445CK08_ARAHY|nr:hypothetical protein Ahy_A06g026287 [Arachis hypogaea]